MAEPRTLPHNPFKRALAAGDPQFGLWLTLESPMATEIVAGSGFDWLLLDMEHGCVGPSDVVQHLRAAKGGTAELVVRIPTNDPVLFKRLLDAGVRSFMVPMVNSADEARAAVAATRYPPDGIRGVAGTTRATDFGRIPGYMEACADQIAVVVQLESPAALAAIPQIGAVDGVDGLFIGPNDLAASLGHRGRPGAPEVKTAIADALDAIKATGKAAGILNFSPAEARELSAAGFSFIAVGGDGSILARRSEALLQDFRPQA